MKPFYRIWLIALFVKLIFAVWLPFSNDEAYYWVWGHHPQWSYFDHPPFVGWLMWVGTFLESFGNAARVPGVILGHFTLLIWNQILKPFLNSEARKFWLVFVLLSPFLGIGSLIITPDVPLLFFWSLSILLLLKLIEKPSALLYAALGASLGLGFCSKYMIVLFVPTALLWLIHSGKWRQIRLHLVPLTIVVGIIFCGPVLYWNAQNDWASFRFQIDHGLNDKNWGWHLPFEYIGGQILLLFPTVVWLALRRSEPKEAGFLHFFGWIPLLFFLYTSFKAPVEANWPIMAHPALLSLALLNMQSEKPLRLTMGVWIIAHGLVLSEVAFNWLPVEPHRLKTSEFRRFDVFLQAADEYESFFLGSYQAAAAVSYKKRKQFYKLGGMNRRDFYDFVDFSHPKNNSGFWVGTETEQYLPSWINEQGYEISDPAKLSDRFSLIEVKPRAQDSHH